MERHPLFLQTETATIFATLFIAAEIINFSSLYFLKVLILFKKWVYIIKE